MQTPETDPLVSTSITALIADPERSVLEDVWERQRAYSQNAKAAQSWFFMLRLWIMRLSVVASILAVVHAELTPDRVKLLELDPVVIVIVNQLLLILPIVITVLLTGAMKFDRGYNWVLLRGSAETLKMEMYYYRTQVGAYSSDRNAELAKKLKTVSERLKGSSVHRASLNPYERDRQSQSSAKPAILTDLDAQGYIQERIEEQFNWYRGKAKNLDRRLQRYFWIIYLLGGLGTFFAATGVGTWVAVTIAMTGACVNYIEFRRDEESLIGYNQAADSLYNIRAWWNSLSISEKARRENLTLLVMTTEATIRNEHLSWLQDMQDRLAQLYAQKEDKENDHVNSPSSPNE